jgi:hypothetical protein
MAFERQYLARIGGSGEGRALWMYASTEDAADVLAANFFLPAKDELNKADVILLVDTNLAGCTVSFVKVNNKTNTVTLASGTAIGDS